MNNILPACVVLDMLKQQELSRDDYIAWLREMAETEWYYQRRLEVERESHD